MPLRPVNRDQAWLLPPTLDDLVPEDHPSRFVAAFVDGLDRIGWAGMEIDVDGDPLGAPAYHPRGTSERLALRVHDWGAILPEVGSGLPGSDPILVADRLAASRPQHAVAVLPGPPVRHAELAKAYCPDGGRSGARGPSSAGSGRYEDRSQRSRRSDLRHGNA